MPVAMLIKFAKLVGGEVMVKVIDVLLLLVQLLLLKSARKALT